MFNTVFNVKTSVSYTKRKIFQFCVMHVQYVVGNDSQLQVHLVEMLTKYCGLQKAAQWSLKYNIPRNQLPRGVWEKQQSLPPDLQ